MKKLLLIIGFCGLFTLTHAQIYVDGNASGSNDGSSWENAYTELSDAIANAGEGSEIWVAAGVYKPGGLGAYRDTSFMITDNIKLYGGFAGMEASLEERGDYEANPTILSGDVDGDDIPGNIDENRTDNCRHVLWTEPSINNNTVIDGFFIQSGHTDGEDGTGNDRRAGGLLSYGAPIVSNCTFRSNYGYYGGAAYPRFENATNIKFLDCDFLNNEGYLGGAMYIISIDNGLFENCKFERNTAESSGGAIYNQNSIDSFVNCEFIENVTGTRAGAVYNVEVDVVYENCSFNNNEALSSSGGALQISDGDEVAHVKISNSTFLGNNSGWGAGVTAYGENASAEIVNCEFSLNNSSTSGAAISIGFQASMTIDSCLFEGNSSDGWAGAIFMQNDNSTLLLRTSDFLSNTADNNGGAINSSSGVQIEIRDCNFESNSAALGESGGFGGAINLSEDSLDFASLDIDRCKFVGNVASEQGGAISVVDVNSSITNSLFAYNISSLRAGAISNNGSGNVAVPGSPMVLLNNTFALNEGSIAGGVVVWEGDGGMASVSMQNNIFNNPRFEELGIEDGDPEIISLGGNLTNNASAATYLDHDDDIIGEDPLFVNAMALDFSIEANSPCRNAGVNDGAPSVDIDSNPRDDMVDIGCYEYDQTNTTHALTPDFTLTAAPSVTSAETTLLTNSEMETRDSELRIYNSNGVLMSRKSLSLVGASFSHKVSLANYPSGIYYLRLVTEKGIGGTSVIKQ